MQLVIVISSCNVRLMFMSIDVLRHDRFCTNITVHIIHILHHLVHILDDHQRVSSRQMWVVKPSGKYWSVVNMQDPTTGCSSVGLYCTTIYDKSLINKILLNLLDLVELFDSYGTTHNDIAINFHKHLLIQNTLHSIKRLRLDTVQNIQFISNVTGSQIIKRLSWLLS